MLWAGLIQSMLRSCEAHAYRSGRRVSDSSWPVAVRRILHQAACCVAGLTGVFQCFMLVLFILINVIL